MYEELTTTAPTTSPDELACSGHLDGNIARIREHLHLDKTVELVSYAVQVTSYPPDSKIISDLLITFNFQCNAFSFCVKDLDGVAYVFRDLKRVYSIDRYGDMDQSPFSGTTVKFSLATMTGATGFEPLRRAWVRINLAERSVHMTMDRFYPSNTLLGLSCMCPGFAYEVGDVTLRGYF